MPKKTPSYEELFEIVQGNQDKYPILKNYSSPSSLEEFICRGNVGKMSTDVLQEIQNLNTELPFLLK